MVSGMNLDLLKKAGKDPCGVCQTGVGIFCGGCLCWIHKKCSAIIGLLRPDPDFKCPRCLGTARPIDGRTVKEVKVDDEKLDAFPELCYLGDMISAGGGCELAVVTRCKCAWGKVRQLLPLLTNGNFPLLTRGRVYVTCIRSVMLHAAETWALLHDDHAMIRWICNVKAATLNCLWRHDRAMIPLICNARQRMKAAQIPFYQSLVSRTWMWSSSPVE